MMKDTFIFDEIIGQTKLNSHFSAEKMNLLKIKYKNNMYNLYQ